MDLKKYKLSKENTLEEVKFCALTTILCLFACLLGKITLLEIETMPWRDREEKNKIK